MKIIINTCYGGFGISHKATLRYAELKGITLYPVVDRRNKRGDLEFGYFQPYVVGERAFLIYYLTEPLLPNGTYKEGSYFRLDQDNRTDPTLIQVVEELGKEANGECAELKIIDIPDGIEYTIDDYDGIESVHEAHQSWY